jgi:hypothetical protein
MSDWETLVRQDGMVSGRIIWPLSECCVEATLFSILSAPGNTIPGVAKGITYYPFTLDHDFTIRTLFWENGSVASGNVAVGVYDADTKAKIIDTGSTGMVGTNTIQQVSVATTIITPGHYYLAGSVDNTTARLFGWSLGSANNFPWGRIAGIVNELIVGTFALPATATPVALSNSVSLGFLPLVGLSELTAI